MTQQEFEDLPYKELKKLGQLLVATQQPKQVTTLTLLFTIHDDYCRSLSTHSDI